MFLSEFKQDVQRWIVPQQISSPDLVTLSTTLKLMIRFPSLRLMFWFRLARWARAKRIPGIPMLMYQFIYHRFGAELRVDTPTGGGLYIAHPAGVVISADSIGENVSIIHSVTIGMRNEWAFPRIGDGAFIGAGARVLGGIEIGKDAQIGANSVVLKDVPDGATVVGVPGKVIAIYGERVQPPAKQTTA